MPFHIVYQTENTQEIMGGGGGDQERSPTGGGRRDREVPGVANLDRSPDQSPGGTRRRPS